MSAFVDRTVCESMSLLLNAYIDDELSGADRFRVSEHLTACAACASEEVDLRGLGQALRVRVEATPVPTALLAGLAGGVTSRVRAEEAQSWRATWNRIFDDWHWVAVGVGSVSMALMSFVLASLMVYSSITQLNRMHSKAGTLSVIALSEGANVEPVLMQYEQLLGTDDQRSRPSMPASYGWEAERALVAALDTALRRSGRPGNLSEMSVADRDEVLALVASINNLRLQTPQQRPGGVTKVIAMHLEMTTSVAGTLSGSGL